MKKYSKPELKSNEIESADVIATSVSLLSIFGSGLTNDNYSEFVEDYDFFR